MSKNTKWLSVLLAIVMVAALATGCGKSSSSESESSGSSGSSSEAYDYSKYIDEDGRWKDIKALSYVKLPEYKGIVIPADVSAVSDEDIQAQIDTLIASYITNEKLTDPTLEIKDGDAVNIDFVGSIDGVEFEGGSTNGSGYDIVVGETTFIDDFIEQLKGHKPGEEFNIEVTFPESYPQNTELQGKDANFKININYIKGEEIIPDLTDEFVKTNFAESKGWNTAAEMKDAIVTSLRENAEYDYLYDYLIEKSEVSEVPENIVKFQEEYMIEYYTNSAAQYSMDLATYLSYVAGVTTAEDLITKNRENLDNSAKSALIMQAIVEDAKIKVGDDAIATYFSEKLGADDYTGYVDFFGLPYVKMAISSDTAMDYVIDNAVRA